MLRERKNTLEPKRCGSLGRQVGVSPKGDILSPQDPAVTLLRIHPEELKTYESIKTRARRLVAARGIAASTCTLLRERSPSEQAASCAIPTPWLSEKGKTIGEKMFQKKISVCERSGRRGERNRPHAGFLGRRDYPA